MQKTEMRIDKSTLNLRTMGLSNWCLDTNSHSKKKKRYSIQFYDYDFKGENTCVGKRGLEGFPRDDLLKILEIFPYDVIMYETKHGIHFISFALLKGLNFTKANAIKTSKEIGHQDYWTEAKDLTLRASAKWKLRFLRKRKIISNKPKFKLVLRLPNKYRISKNHLEFYLKYMNLPQWVYDLYDECDKKDLRIKMYHYKTRD